MNTLRNIALLVCFFALPALSAAEGPLAPLDEAALAARVKQLAESGPAGATVAAYLDCGAQRESAGDGVKIRLMKGMPYQFPSEASGVPLAGATVFFDPQSIEFELSGLDRSARYTVGLTWWDYDAAGRSQSVVVTSPDSTQVRLPVPAIGLPNYKDAGLPPAERRFSLPATIARDGRLRLLVQNAAGANAVISELWIWRE